VGESRPSRPAAAGDVAGASPVPRVVRIRAHPTGIATRMRVRDREQFELGAVRAGLSAEKLWNVRISLQFSPV
jgi:hypothetical protein